jgi:hypothetical protein
MQSQIKTVCSSYPEIVSSSASLLEQFALQPADVTEQFNNEVMSQFTLKFVNLLQSLYASTDHCCHHIVSVQHHMFGLYRWGTYEQDVNHVIMPVPIPAALPASPAST